MKLNVKTKKPVSYNHESQPAQKLSSEKELRRAVLSCLLWESNFYESGESISDRIASLIVHVKAEKVAFLAIEARQKYKLRHVPLLLVREMAKLDTHKHLVANTLATVIQRADELTEFLAIYWKEKRQPLSNQVKKGLAKAFQKFDEHQLAKYNRDGDIKLRDVLFLCHAKPKNKEQAKVFKKLVDKKLKTPDTWEVALSSGADKKETFTRLVKENMLGGLAVLRNLRNMIEAKCHKSIVKSAIESIDTSRILPFRFITAAKFAPEYEGDLEEKMFNCLKERKNLSGRTIVLVDVSGSMDSALSNKSDTTCLDTACGLAIMARELCKDVAIYTFSSNEVKVPSRRGFALRDAIVKSQPHMSTQLYSAVEKIKKLEKFDRLIIITDEQATDRGSINTKNSYIINVSTHKNGVIASNGVTRIDGWSEAVLDYIAEIEE